MLDARVDYVLWPLHRLEPLDSGRLLDPLVHLPPDVPIEAETREDGKEINPANYRIAGTVREAGAANVTADPDFERVRGLDVQRYDEEE